MDFKRIATIVLGLPIVVIFLVFANKYMVDVLFALVTIISMHEYFNAFKEKANPVKWIGYISAIAISFIHIIPTNYILPIITVTIPTIIIILFLHIIITNMKITLNDIMITFFGICYISLFTMFIPMVKGIENGSILIWYIFIASWGTDTFAYLVGKKFGKHKFSKVSPNKSIEGCISGLIGAIILCLIYTYIVNSYLSMNISYTFILVLSIILSILSQIGDFSASCIKRYAEIKDYGNLLPGHGGMLDRIDSVIFIAPVAYLLLTLI